MKAEPFRINAMILNPRGMYPTDYGRKLAEVIIREMTSHPVIELSITSLTFTTTRAAFFIAFFRTFRERKVDIKNLTWRTRSDWQVDLIEQWSHPDSLNYLDRRYKTAQPYGELEEPCEVCEGAGFRDDKKGRAMFTNDLSNCYMSNCRQGVTRTSKGEAFVEFLRRNLSNELEEAVNDKLHDLEQDITEWVRSLDE